METQHYHKKRDKEVEEEKSKHESKESNSSTKQQLATITSSPPSASSSPSHEFSFTISVHPTSAAAPDKTKAVTVPPSFAIDLSPADDIFFHGHLLPLHLISHLPISPRSSTNSLDSFSLPIKDLLEDAKPNNNSNNNNNNNDTNNSISNYNGKDDCISNINNRSHRRSSKAKSFPLFGLARWRKGCEVGSEKEKQQEDDQMKMKKKKKKVRLNVTHILRRYIRMVRPLLVFRGRRDNRPIRRQPHSFSGNLSWKGKQQEWRGRREHSAPASLWTSPTNSGLLVATTALHSAKSDSTMEELQSAIQAAIAHCKNSIAVKEEKLKC